MDDYSPIILLVAGILVFSLLSIGIVKMINLSFKGNPEVESVDTTQKLSEQQLRMEEIKMQQKILRERRRDSLRDYNR